MIRTKARRTSRAREMRDDLSILMGIQQVRRIQKYPTHSHGGSQVFPGGYASANHRSSAVVTRYQQDSLQFNGSHEGAMFLPPPFVTPAACRAARMGRLSEIRPKNSRWPICSSQPIKRIQNTNPDGFRQPAPFMLDCVQQPPTPAQMGPIGIFGTPQNQSDANKPSTFSTSNFLIQSPWVNRTDFTKPSSSSSVPGTPLSEVTSKYSVKELIDSLCGEGPEIPEICEIFPSKATNKGTHNSKEVVDSSPFGLPSASTSCDNQMFLESGHISPSLFDDPQPWSEDFLVPSTQIPSTLFEPMTSPPKSEFELRPSLRNATGGFLEDMDYFGNQNKQKTVSFMMEPTELSGSKYLFERFEEASTHTQFKAYNQLISTPPCSVSTKSSSPPTDVTTSCCVSPFFTDGLSFLQNMYGIGDESSGICVGGGPLF